MRAARRKIRYYGGRRDEVHLGGAVLPAFQHAKMKGTNMKSTLTISAPRNPKAGLGVLRDRQQESLPERQVAGVQVSVI
jgi:hypothetical protein